MPTAQANKASMSVEEWNAEKASRILDAYRASGYTVPNEEEEGDAIKVNLVAFKLFILDLLGGALVRTPAEKDGNAISKGQLARKVFPNTPGAKPGEAADLDEMDAEVWVTLMGQAWTAVNPYVGQMQNLVGEQYQGMVLVMTPPAGRITIESNGDRVDAVYITDCEELIFADFDKLLKDAVTKAEAKRAKALTIVALRQPHLAKRALKEIADRSAKDAAVAFFKLNAPSAE